MSDIHIRTEGRAGRITLTRPKALNALSYDMCLAIDAALKDWRDDPAVACVLIDAQGDKAFCAGGDIVQMYNTASAGDFDYGRRFWRDEYRMNARIAVYPKPVQSLLQGYTMGGGVGLGCHAASRIVGATSRIAMPECAIGMVPDVGGSLLLAQANQRCAGAGAWAGTTGHRLTGAQAIALGLADRSVPEADWADLRARAIDTGAPDCGAQTGQDTEPLAEIGAIASHFTAATPAEVMDLLREDGSDPARSALTALERGSPLAIACHMEILRRLGPTADIRDALRLEHRFCWRAASEGDFIEGIRAALIDKDRTPRWRHGSLEAVTPTEVAAMLAPLGADELTFDEED